MTNVVQDERAVPRFEGSWSVVGASLDGRHGLPHSASVADLAGSDDLSDFRGLPTP